MRLHYVFQGAHGRFVPFLVLLLTACGQPGYHIVRPGETLYSISWRYARDYQKLAEWNGLKPPYRLHPGQRIRLEPGRREGRLGPPAPKPVPATTERQPSRPEARSPAAHAAVAARNAVPARRPSPEAAGPIRWTWPSEAPIVRRFRSGAEGIAGSGIDFAGRAGQPVLSAAGGRVVYSGEGIPSYGRLVIVKHSDEFLSAYAYNRRLLVKEGDRVRAGQKIAEMGMSGSGTKRVLLHFEIRRRGRPVDPMKYLPPRGR